MKQLIIMLVIASAFLASCSEKQEMVSEQEAVRKVKVLKITDVDLGETLEYSGNLEADKVVVQAFAVSGDVSSVLVKEGDEVEKGEVLAVLEGTNYINSLKIAEASLLEAQDTFDRLNMLYKKGSLPEKDFVSAKANLARAQANKSIAQKQVNDLKLRAEVGGVIARKQIEVGGSANPGAPAFTIVKIDKLYSSFTVPEVEIGKISKDNKAMIAIPTMNENVSGVVSIVNPVADPVSKSYKVKVYIENDSRRLLPGMITTNSISTGKELQQIVIPFDAVVRDADDIPYVFVLDGKIASRKRVTISGIATEGVVIGTGLHVGDEVIVEGQVALVDGQLVRV